MRHELLKRSRDMLHNVSSPLETAAVADSPCPRPCHRPPPPCPPGTRPPRPPSHLPAHHLAHTSLLVSFFVSSPPLTLIFPSGAPFAMADPTNLATLQSPYSFPSAHLVHYAAARPGKRRASDASHFIPAEATFNPRPYQPPHAANSSFRQASRPPPSQASSTSTSSRQNSVQRNRPTQAADPTPNDPKAVFIHPPFTDFPDAHRYKDGLTYNLMAANPEWFLDSADFIAPGNDNPDAIGYPSQLEPPRGWCPQKKTKEGWAQGDEPKLRCTFCRRFYSGANAKSMWRRHVLEKHKIAMSNRRDNPTGRGGRTSNSACTLCIVTRCTDPCM